jgi:hypothetical protein
MAFKEWAAVCLALEQGKQSLILRKGGIHEGRQGFRVEHAEFWLYPTGFHQEADVLTAEARPLLEHVRSRQPQTGTVALKDYVIVEDVIEIHDEQCLPRFEGLHIWSFDTVQSRFRYRNPLLFALLVRVYSLDTPIIIEDRPQFAGCRSWVDLGEELSTEGLRPILTDEQHRASLAGIRAAVTG